MAKFPEPDVDRIRALRPTLRMAHVGLLAWRVYFQGGPYPSAWNDFRHFGPTGARFDHHEEPPRSQSSGITYLATLPQTAMAETFQADRTIDRHRREPWLVAFRLAASLDLLDLSGAWPTAAGASMAIASGPRPRARRWSRVIHAAYPAVDGLWYPSSMYANQPALALYERARRGIPMTPELDRALADPLLLPVLRRLAAEIGYRLV